MISKVAVFQYAFPKTKQKKTIPILYSAHATFNCPVAYLLFCNCATESLVINDPDFQHEDLNFMSRSERYDESVKKSIQMFSKLRDYGIGDPEEINLYKRYW